MECETIVEFAACVKAGDPVPANVIGDLRHAVGVAFMRDRVRGDSDSLAKITAKKRMDMRNQYIRKAADALEFHTVGERIRIIRKEDDRLNGIWRTCGRDDTPRPAFSAVQKALFFAKKIAFDIPSERQLRRILKAHNLDI